MPSTLQAVGERLTQDRLHVIKAVLVVHTETAAGTTSDVAAIRRAQSVPGIGGRGIGPLLGKAFRIGHMGDVNERILLGTLAVVEMAPGVAKIPHGRGACSLQWPCWPKTRVRFRLLEGNVGSNSIRACRPVSWAEGGS